MEEQEKQLKTISNLVKKILHEKPAFFGSIKLNFHNGQLVNSNILETVLHKGEANVVTS